MESSQELIIPRIRRESRIDRKSRSHDRTGRPANSQETGIPPSRMIARECGIINVYYFNRLFSINRGMKIPPCTLLPLKWQYSPVTVSYQSPKG